MPEPLPTPTVPHTLDLGTRRFCAQHMAMNRDVGGSDTVAAETVGLTATFVMYGAADAESDQVEPPARLLERLRQIDGYTWDESRRPFHSSYDIW
jgi:hypothetical protein